MLQELFGGYSRFRTVFKADGIAGLREELRSDITGLWLKNLGRDDRVIADTAREARHPFLDEQLAAWSLEQPVETLCNLDLDLGVGDKLILREALRSLGLRESAMRVKRAIHFGSRLGKKFNVAAYGSSRAANKCSAGTDNAW